MEQNLEIMLAWLGLSQYHGRLLQAGYESWDTLLDITEDDLEDLGVEISHRRKLQEEIQKTQVLASTQKTRQMQDDPPKGHSYDRQQMATYLDLGASNSLTAEPNSLAVESTAPTKRGYRHRPKLDPNAPKRPYSAYMLFSNHVRDLLASEKLDFPEISRQVGRRWQALGKAEMDMWKWKALPLWEKYRLETAQYQDTEDFAEHRRYLEEFWSLEADKMERRDRKGAKKDNFKKGTAGSGGVANMYPSPARTSARTSCTPSESHSPTSAVAALSGPWSGGRSTKPEPKIGIKKIREPAKEAVKDVDQKPKSKQACEPCRRRKSKCNEAKPTCGHCLALNADCYYSSAKVHIDKRKLQEMSETFETCQKLLVRIKPLLQQNEQYSIQKTLDSRAEEIINNAMSLAEAHSLTVDDPGVPIANASNDLDHASSNDEKIDLLATAVEGQGSDAQWMQSLMNELNQEGSGRQPTQLRFESPARFNNFAEDNESAVVGRNVDPYQLPVELTADALVHAYFSSVHASFPVLQQPLFMYHYVKSKTFWHRLVEFEDQAFLATLQLVLAIGAVHARFSNSELAADDRDHLLYFARARMLAFDGGFLNDVIHLGQAQIFGLNAIYCLATLQMNRAWIASGLAIRAAQSLGLHLSNDITFPATSDQGYRSRIWSALVTLERTLAVIMGHPTMVRDWGDRAESLTGDTENRPAPIHHSDKHKMTLPKKRRGSAISQSSRESMTEACHESSFSCVTSAQSQFSIEESYFKHHVDLAALLHRSLSRLYDPSMRQRRWSKIQVLVDGFDDRLSTWERNLDSYFTPPTSALSLDVNFGHAPLDVALAIQFHCARITINLPCLCEQKQRNSKQPPLHAIFRCISSARDVIKLITNKSASTIPRPCPQWWLVPHHMKRALTALLLELAFRAEHMPSEAESLLAAATAGVEWLHQMGQTSSAAKCLWITMKPLLVRAGARVGIEVGTRDVSNPGHSSSDRSLRHPNTIPADWIRPHPPSMHASSAAPFPFSATVPLETPIDPSPSPQFAPAFNPTLHPHLDQPIYPLSMDSVPLDISSLEQLLSAPHDVLPPGNDGAPSFFVAQ